MNSNTKKYLVFDIGGTAVKWAIITNQYKILKKGQYKTEIQKNDINLFVNNIKEIFSKNKEHNLSGIGISTFGAVNSNGVVFAGVPHFSCLMDFDLKSKIEEITNLPTFVENDANAALMGESNHKKFINMNNIIMITIGTGIGGGAIIDGKLLKGSNNFGAEFGAMRCFGPQGEEWSNLASTKYLLSRVSDELKTKINGFDFFKILKTNEIVQEIYDEFLTNIALGLSNLAISFDPEIFIIGGGISENSNFATDDILVKMKNIYHDNPYMQKHIKVSKAQYGNSAGLIGITKLLINYEKTL